jgi:PIN domain nuclease of toxin-antitoxin system
MVTSRECRRRVAPRIPTLVIRTAHIRRLAGVPELHKDPFDRILVAQAWPALVARYGAPVVWE